MTAPIEVPCSACKSRPGQLCVKHGIGMPDHVHKSRKRAARLGWTNPDAMPPRRPAPRVPFEADRIDASAITVRCPSCHATRGQPCFEPETGQVRKHAHKVRRLSVGGVRSVVSGGLPSLGKGSR